MIGVGRLCLVPLSGISVVLNISKCPELQRYLEYFLQHINNKPYYIDTNDPLPKAATKHGETSDSV